MRRAILVLLAVTLTGCATATHAKPLDPCCPPYADVPVAPLPVSTDRRAVTRLIAASPGAALRSVRTIDAYQVVDLGTVGALLSNDVVVDVWEVR